MVNALLLTIILNAEYTVIGDSYDRGNYCTYNFTDDAVSCYIQGTLCRRKNLLHK